MQSQRECRLFFFCALKRIVRCSFFAICTAAMELFVTLLREGALCILFLGELQSHLQQWPVLGDEHGDIVLCNTVDNILSYTVIL